MKLFEELKRRNVFRIATAYVLLAWIVVQVTDTVSPALRLPDWTLAFVTWIGIIGFPFALVFAWAYELTPDGIRREVVGTEAEANPRTAPAYLDLTLVVLLTVAIGFMAWESIRDDPTPGPAAASNRPDDMSTTTAADHSPAESIAVLPLVNMSGIAENEFFAGGVHEEILTNLSIVDELRVISRTTMMSYLNSNRGVREIGRELGVHYVVEGSVRRIGNHVRITVQLVDARNDAHVWARNYDRQLVDVFGTQSEVAREITNSLMLHILPGKVDSLHRMPTSSVKAYDLFSRANNIHRSEAISEDAYRRQRELLEAAVAEDPDFVEAWARLNDHLDEIARTIAQHEWFGDTREERDAYFAETRKAAKRALDRAVALDPDNVATLLARGSDAISEFTDPEFRVGRLQYLDRARELDPTNGWIWYTLGWYGWDTQNFEQANEAFQKALELEPFHAHIVGGSLNYYRLRGDEEMVALLADRYVQIAPEQVQDEFLSQIPSAYKLSNIFSVFVASADEAALETLVQTYNAEEFVAPPGFGQSRDYWAAQVLSLQNDVDGLLALNAPRLRNDGDFEDELLQALLTSNILLGAHRAGGGSEGAIAIAEHILELRAEVRPGTQPLDTRFVLDVNLLSAVAYAALEDEESLRRTITEIQNSDQMSAISWNAWFYIAYSYLDRDKAVEMLLEKKAAYPRWPGTDIIATAQMRARQLVTHPDLQDFYTKEGKWTNYLAARVPAYAQFRQ